MTRQEHKEKFLQELTSSSQKGDGKSFVQKETRVSKKKEMPFHLMELQ